MQLLQLIFILLFGFHVSVYQTLDSNPAIRPSLFPHVPPYINFCSPGENCERLPLEIKRFLKWQLTSNTPLIVQKTVKNSGFNIVKNGTEWTGQWSKQMVPQDLKNNQKLCILPCGYNIVLKDKLWENCQRMNLKFSNENFEFMPKTYVLPREKESLRKNWNKWRGEPWIVKPPGGARGEGVQVVNKWKQIPRNSRVIVQKYLSNPFLIKDKKFDIRLYVLVTSIHPLKIYLYREGIVRFASVKYSNDSKRVSDRCMHLTNYNVNKHCDSYVHNNNTESLEGNKWTLTSLWSYLSENGYNADAIKSKIKDIVIKTMLCAEDKITACVRKLPSRYNGFGFFGFDVILDNQLKPWLLEVNVGPALNTNSPLDISVKGPLVKELLNIVGYHIPNTLPNSLKKKIKKNTRLDFSTIETPVFDKRLYCSKLSQGENSKQKRYAFAKRYLKTRDNYLSKIIENLTPDDIRHLVQAEDELSQCDVFKRIFPSPTSHEYFKFIEGSRYYNQLLEAWEFTYATNHSRGIERLKKNCSEKIHLQCF